MTYIIIKCYRISFPILRRFSLSKSITRKFLNSIIDQVYDGEYDPGGSYGSNPEPYNGKGNYRNAADILYHRICKSIPKENYKISLHPLEYSRRLHYYNSLVNDGKISPMYNNPVHLTLLVKTSYDPFKAAMLHYQLDDVNCTFGLKSMPEGFWEKLVLNVPKIKLADQMGYLRYSIVYFGKQYEEYKTEKFSAPIFSMLAPSI